jgi:hypothetical protein
VVILWWFGVVSAYKLGKFVYPMLFVERVVLFIDLITGVDLPLGEIIFHDEPLR